MLTWKWELRFYDISYLNEFEVILLCMGVINNSVMLQTKATVLMRECPYLLAIKCIDYATKYMYIKRLLEVLILVEILLKCVDYNHTI